MYIFGCKFPPRGGGNSGFCSRTPSRRRRRGHVATFFNFRQHDRNASGEPPWTWDKTTARNAAAPPRLQREQAPLLRGRIPLKINHNLHGDRPAWEARRTSRKTRSVDTGASAAPGQLRWRQGRRKPRRTAAGSTFSGRTLDAGLETTSMAASRSVEKGGCAGATSPAFVCAAPFNQSYYYSPQSIVHLQVGRGMP